MLAPRTEVPLLLPPSAPIGALLWTSWPWAVAPRRRRLLPVSTTEAIVVVDGFAAVPGANICEQRGVWGEAEVPQGASSLPLLEFDVRPSAVEASSNSMEGQTRQGVRTTDCQASRRAGQLADRLVVPCAVSSPRPARISDSVSP